MHKYKQAEVKEGTEIHTIQTHHWGLMPEPIPQAVYCKSQVMCPSQEDQAGRPG